MGRPLLSTLITPKVEVRVAEPEPEEGVNNFKLPTYDRWSYINAFDPDSDEFFEGDNVVYEAFLTPEEAAERERERERERDGAERMDPPNVIRVPVSSQGATARRLHLVARIGDESVRREVPGEDERPDLVSPTGDDSSSSGSDTASSGRTSPAETDELLDASRLRRRREEVALAWHPSDLDDLSEFIPSTSLARSLPTTPTRASWLVESPVVFARPEEMPMPIPPASSGPVDIPAPASPMPRPAQTIPPSPMTPPGSVTPRFLTWGGNGARPRAIDMNPSPTPAAPFGSARASASRMSLSYISPPALRVQQ